MSTALANHNPDIQKLIDKGYAVRVDGPHLVIRDIPYLDSNGDLQIGAIIAKLEYIDKHRVKQDNHQVYFAGSSPYGLNGAPVPNLGDSPTRMVLNKPDVVVQRAFSNKPVGKKGYPDFFEKIEHYVCLISGPAMERHGATPYTYRADADVMENSVFKFHDTLTSRAEIGDLTPVFKEEIVAVIGLGGTGAYILDFLVKTPVLEIRGFDSDYYHVHNAYRSPGKLEEVDLGKSKAEVYFSRYENFRKGLSLQRKYIDKSCAADLAGVTFAFVCVDKGSARAEIFQLLKELRIPFIDVGIGVKRKQGRLAGSIRITYYSVDAMEVVFEKRLAPLADDPDDEYRNNIQIAELNAFNASLAVMKYKQVRGFYFDSDESYHFITVIELLKIFSGSDE
jgi:hypothetical protein